MPRYGGPAQPAAAVDRPVHPGPETVRWAPATTDETGDYRAGQALEHLPVNGTAANRDIGHHNVDHDHDGIDHRDVRHDGIGHHDMGQHDNDPGDPAGAGHCLHGEPESGPPRYAGDPESHHTNEPESHHTGESGPDHTDEPPTGGPRAWNDTPDGPVHSGAAAAGSVERRPEHPAPAWDADEPSRSPEAQVEDHGDDLGSDGPPMAETGDPEGVDPDAHATVDSTRPEPAGGPDDSVAEEAAFAASTPGLRPGDVAQTTLAVWDDAGIQRFHDDWHEVKALFVDEPEEALAQAGELVTAAVNEVTAALLAEQRRLDPLRQSAAPDTETMRIAMRRYREFLDRILAL